MRSLSHNKTIIFCTQHLDEAEYLSENILILKEGKVDFFGKIAKYKQANVFKIHNSETIENFNEEFGALIISESLIKYEGKLSQL